MKTETILTAIAALDAARDLLNQTAPSPVAQVNVGLECHRAAYRLRLDLQQEHPEVTVAA